jgi:hypothetical protein
VACPVQAILVEERDLAGEPGCSRERLVSGTSQAIDRIVVVVVGASLAGCERRRQCGRGFTGGMTIITALKYLSLKLRVLRVQDR